jgi:hypothetical protein
MTNRQKFKLEFEIDEDGRIIRINNVTKNDGCLHDSCTSCGGTGVTHTGGLCVHMISCSCPKCRVYCC